MANIRWHLRMKKPPCRLASDSRSWNFFSYFMGLSRTGRRRKGGGKREEQEISFIRCDIETRETTEFSHFPFVCVCVREEGGWWFLPSGYYNAWCTLTDARRRSECGEWGWRRWKTGWLVKSNVSLHTSQRLTQPLTHGNERKYTQRFFERVNKCSKRKEKKKKGCEA